MEKLIILFLIGMTFSYIGKEISDTYLSGVITGGLAITLSLIFMELI